MAAPQMRSFLSLCAFVICSSVGFSNGYEADRKRVIEDCMRRNQLPSSSIVYLNGTIYTVDGDDWDDNSKQAIVIEDRQIVFVGSNEDAEGYIIVGLSLVYNLHGAVILPGFHDIHMHPLEAMSPLYSACELPSLTPPDDADFTKALSECAEHRDDTLIDWVLGFGHSITPLLEYFRNSVSPKSPKQLLDSYINDRPVAILEETSHSAWVNSMALEMANITSSTPERTGGIIMREPNSNEPNGILFENEAIDIFALAMNATSDEILEFNYLGLLDAMEKLAKNGITSVCDARVFWKIYHDIAWQDACKEGKLTVRAILGLWAYPDEDDNYQINKLKTLYPYQPSNNACSLRKTQIKVYMDGIVHTTTAAMDEEYRINLSLPIISEKNVGINYFTKARLKDYLIALQEFDNGMKGFDFHIHAIGDRGIREALDAIEEAKSSLTSRKPRHRLTHLELLNETDVDRFNSLGVIADFQVAGEFTLPSEHVFFAEFVGTAKAEFSIPVKSVTDTGALTTFSSDWDVSDLNPFVGIQHATQRGDQSVTVKTAVEMYTINPAIAMRHEDKVGKLRVGMEADLVIFDTDILHAEENRINSTKVLETVFMGESIYWKPNDIIENVTSNYYCSRASYYCWYDWSYLFVLGLMLLYNNILIV